MTKLGLKMMLFYTVGLVMKLSIRTNAAPLTYDTTVVHISVMFRHGNRVPIYDYPNDPIDPFYWEKYGSPGDITPKGLKTEYDLGAYIRNYYGFLNETYSSSRVRVRSSDVDRTLMSAQAFMAGIFRPSNDQKWTQDLNWYPIPVHTEPISNDHLLTYSIPCPRYDALMIESYERPEKIKFTQENQVGIVDSWYRSKLLLNKAISLKMHYTSASTFSGLSSTDQEDDMILRLVDTLSCEIAEGLSIPKWANDNYAKYRELFDYAFYLTFRGPEMARFASGSQLNEIRNNLILKANGSSTYELSVYSTHDANLAAMIELLNSSLPRIQPSFGSALIFELRKDDSQRYFVRLMAKFNNPNEPIRLQEVRMKECEDILCPLEKFIEATSSKIITDLSKECEL